jgi:3-methyladenine DNA glycosylase AlkD
MLSQAELLTAVRAELASHAEPRFRDALLWFFKEPVDPYGVRAAKPRPIVQMVYREVKAWPAADRNAFCEALWESGKLEEGVLVAHVYRRFHKQCAQREFKLFERWIDRNVRNWANCDGVAGWLLAACIANEPALIERLPAWTRSRNRWKRRAAAVALLQEAKKGRNTDAILRIAGSLIEDPDDMVQKGVGWTLKEAYPKQPGCVVAFLSEHKSRISRLVLRIAAEKMNPGDRATVLR